MLVTTVIREERYWNGDDPYMWNPEARDPSPIIYFAYIHEFMGEDQDAAAAREEGDKTEPMEKSRCGIG